MKTVLSVLFSATVVSAVQLNYVAPVASGYIYRSDNNGPASLIQLGAIPYQHPQVFAAPLPLVQPAKLEALEAYDLEPVPLPYVAAQPITVEDVEEDDDDDNDESDESSEEYLDGSELSGQGHGHGHTYEKGAGSDYGEQHHSAHGEKGSKGYNSKDHHAIGESGQYGKEHHGRSYSEGEGEKKSHHDEAAAHGKHYAAGESYKGGDHGRKKHFSKGEDVTGYHKVFSKDEFKKDHDFYDVADNSGHFKKHGYQNAHHGSEEGGHKEAAHHNSASKKGGFGKAGYQAKGHHDVDDIGHSAEEGNESHYNHEEDYGKKGGSGGQKEYAYGDAEHHDDESEEY